MGQAVVALFGAVVGALIGGVAAWRTAVETRKAAIQATETQRHTARVEEWWDRFTWLIAHRRTLPGPITLGILDRLTDTARDLGDDDSVAFAEQFASNLYTLTVGAMHPSTWDVEAP